jgi:hypothetical protein
MANINTDNIPNLAIASAMGVPQDVWSDMVWDDMTLEGAMDARLGLGDDIALDELPDESVEMALYQQKFYDEEMEAALNQGAPPEVAEMQAGQRVDGMMTPHGMGLTMDEIGAVKDEYPGIDSVTSWLPFEADWGDWWDKAEELLSRDNTIDEVIDAADSYAAATGNLDNIDAIYNNIGNEWEYGIDQLAEQEDSDLTFGLPLLAIGAGSGSIDPASVWEGIKDVGSWIKDSVTDALEDVGERRSEDLFIPRDEIQQDSRIQDIHNDWEAIGTGSFIEQMKQGYAEGWMDPVDVEKWLDSLGLSETQMSQLWNGHNDALNAMKEPVVKPIATDPIEQPAPTPTPAAEAERFGRQAARQEAPPAAGTQQALEYGPAGYFGEEGDSWTGEDVGGYDDTQLIVPREGDEGRQPQAPGGEGLDESAVGSTPREEWAAISKVADGTLGRDDAIAILVQYGWSHDNAEYMVDNKVNATTPWGSLFRVKLLDLIPAGQAKAETDLEMQAFPRQPMGKNFENIIDAQERHGLSYKDAETYVTTGLLPEIDVKSFLGQGLNYSESMDQLFKQAFNRIPGSGSYEAQSVLPQMMEDARTLWYLNAMPSGRHGPDVQNEMNVRYGKTDEAANTFFNFFNTAQADAESKGSKGFLTFAENFLTNPDERKGRRFQDQVEALRDSMLRFKGTASFTGIQLENYRKDPTNPEYKAIFRDWNGNPIKLYDNENVADTLWQRTNFMNQLDGTSRRNLVNLITLYNAPEGSDLHTTNRMRNMWNTELNKWLDGGRAMEDFFDVFTQKQSPAARKDQETRIWE